MPNNPAAHMNDRLKSTCRKNVHNYIPLPLHQLKTIHGMDLFDSCYRFKPSERPEIAINHQMFFRWLTDGENTIVTPSEINPTPSVLRWL